MGFFFVDVSRDLFARTFYPNGSSSVSSTLLFLIFFTEPAPEQHEPGSPPPPTWRDALTVVLTCGATFVATSTVAAVFLFRYPQHLQPLANTLGIFAAVLACIQYLPQIWTTWKLQHVMSLSIPMMMIQTPGAFVFATSLALRFGAAGWSTWGVYIVTGCLQGCLLFMAINFELRDRRQRKHAEQSGANGSAHVAQNRTRRRR